MTRALLTPDGHLLNHTELVYAPGERELARRVFETLGCRVEDPGGPFLVVLIDPAGESFLDNCLYASEVTAEQWDFEQQLRRDLAGDGALAQRHRAYADRFAREPQRATHFGIRLGSGDELDKTLARIEAARGELRERLRVSAVFRPGEPGALVDYLIQAFVRTDVVAAGLLTLGQHVELQVELSS